MVNAHADGVGALGGAVKVCAGGIDELWMVQLTHMLVVGEL